MKQVRLSQIRLLAPLKKPGYLEASLATGKPTRGGQWLTFTDEDYEKLGREYATQAAPRATHAPRARHNSQSTHQIPFQAKRGLGDAIHAVAGPIGKAIGWPCLKGDGTTDLKPDSLCAKIKNAANKISL